MNLSKFQIDLLIKTLDKTVQDIRDKHNGLKGIIDLAQTNTLLTTLLNQQKDFTTGKIVDLDPDVQIHYLNVLANYHSYLCTKVNKSISNLPPSKAHDYMDSCYTIGSIEGRILNGVPLQDDIDVLVMWEEELEDDK